MTKVKAKGVKRGNANRTADPVPMAVFERIAPALRVLAHPHRLKIVELLERDCLTVGELAGELKIAPSACSQHLNLMRAHGLLGYRREGTSVHYHVEHPSAQNIIKCIVQHET